MESPTVASMMFDVGNRLKKWREEPTAKTDLNDGIKKLLVQLALEIK